MSLPRLLQRWLVRHAVDEVSKADGVRRVARFTAQLEHKQAKVVSAVASELARDASFLWTKVINALSGRRGADPTNRIGSEAGKSVTSERK